MQVEARYSCRMWRLSNCHMLYANPHIIPRTFRSADLALVDCNGLYYFHLDLIGSPGGSSVTIH